MKKSTIVAAWMFSNWCSVLFANPSVYELVLESKKCKERSSQTISCEYRVGETLHFSIDGIGDPDTGITFLKSDIDGDFYATYGVSHGCIVIKPGFKEGSDPLSGYAFVSPKNGKVYKSWAECKNDY